MDLSQFRVGNLKEYILRHVTLHTHQFCKVQVPNWQTHHLFYHGCNRMFSYTGNDPSSPIPPNMLH